MSEEQHERGEAHTHEHHTEKKEETKSIKIPRIFSRISSFFGSEDRNNDWRFGMAFLGIIALFYFQVDIIILFAWIFAWFLFLSYLEK